MWKLRVAMLCAAVVAATNGARADLVYQEDFSGDDGGYTVANTGNMPGPWVYDGAETWTADGTDSGPGHSRLTSPTFTITDSGSTQLSFVHRYSIEGGLWDGAAVFTSINGGPFEQVPGTSFTSNGYTGVGLIGNHDLNGGEGYNGDSVGYANGTYITSVAELGSLADGDTLALQFLGAWDEGARGSLPNWQIDSVEVFTVAGLRWDNAGSGNWDSAQWVGGPPSVPNDTSYVLLDAANTDTVTVAADAVAYDLSVEGGGIAIDGGQSLAVSSAADFATGATLSLAESAMFSAGATDFAAGTTLSLADDATFSADSADFAAGATVSLANGTTFSAGSVDFAAGTSLTLGSNTTFSAGLGNIPAIAPTGDLTIDVTGTALHGAGYDDSTPADTPRTLTKSGGGILSLPFANVTADQTALVVQGGALALTGTYAPGVVDSVTLDGGAIQIFGQYTPGAANVLQYARFDGGNSPSNLSGIDDGVANGQNGGLLAMAEGVTTDWTGPINITQTDDNYAEIYYGTFTAPATGTYTFKTEADDFEIFWMDVDQNGEFEGPAGDPTQPGLDRITVNVPPEGWNTSHTASVTLAAGQSYPMVFAWYENGGGDWARFYVTAPGGEEMFVNPGDAAQDGWWSNNGTYDAIDASGLEVNVTADSTLNLRTDSTATVGPTTITAGTLTTTGAKGGVTFADGITVGAGATKIGLNPGVPTDYGQVDAAASPDVVIAKGGNGTWTLTSDPVVNGPGSSWAVEGGSLQLGADNVLGGRPILVVGGTLSTSGAFTIGNTDITLDGGTFEVTGEERDDIANLLAWGKYEGGNSDANLTGIDDGAVNGENGGLFALTPNQQGGWITAVDDDSFTTGDNYAFMWSGSFNVPVTGDYTFATRADDFEIFWMDLNQNGDFEEATGEQLTRNTSEEGWDVEKTATVTLTAGETYPLAFAYYENGGGEYGRLWVTAPGGAKTLVNPGDAAQDGWWAGHGHDAVDVSDASLTVVSDSTIHAVTDIGATVAAPTLVGGVLTTTSTNGKITFQGVNIDPSATRIGFDPQAETDYGVIANNSTQPELTIVKAGPSTWALDVELAGATGASNVTWEVAEGTLEIAGTAPLAGRPVVLSGGTMRLTSSWAVPSEDVGAVTDGMAIRFDASSGVTVDANGVATWADSAPGADGTYDAAVNAAAAAPVWVDNEVNGNAVVRFDGTDQQRLSFLQYDDMLSVLWVLSEDADLDPSKRPPLLGDDDTYPFNRQVGRGSMWGGWSASEVRDGLTMLNGKEVVPWRNVDGNVPPPAEPGIISLVLTGHLTGLGGVHAGSSDGVRTGVSQIGQDRSSAGRSWDGDFADIIIYDTQLSDAQVRQMTEHLAYRYGIEVEQRGDYSGVDLSVAADSTLDIDTPFDATLNSLTLQNGTLSTLGRTPSVAFTATTIDAGVDGAVGLNVNVPTSLGPINVVGTDPVTFAKSGPADLVLNSPTTGLAANSTVSVSEGRLIAANDVNPLGAAGVQMSGGEILLAGTTAGTDIAYDNALRVDDSSTVTAGAGGVGPAGPLTVTLGSAANGVTVNNGTLTLGTTDDYSLKVAGAVNGAGSVKVAAGTVTLAGGGAVSRLNVAGGTAVVGADMAVDTLNLSAGVVNAGASQVVISNRLFLGETTFSIDAGNTFAASGVDIVNQGALTLSGGTLTVGSPGAPAGAYGRWLFDEATGTTVEDTSVNGDAPGELMGNVSWVDDPQRGTVLQLGAWDDYVEVQDFSLTTGTITYAAWVNAHKNANWAGITNSRGTQATGMHWGANDTLHYTWNNNNPSTYNWEGGPSIPDDQWVFVALTIDPDKTVAYVGVDGTLTSGENTMGHVEQTVDALQFGRDNCCGTDRFLVGLLDDVYIYDRALTAEEVEALFLADPAGSTVDLPGVSIVATADSVLDLETDDDAVFGDLTVDAGVTVTIDGQAASFSALTAGDGATVNGTVLMRGPLTVADGIGTVNVSELELDEDASYIADVAAAASDKVVIETDGFVGGTLTLNGISAVGAAAGEQHLSVMETAGQEGEIIGEFAVVPAVGDHVGAGIFAIDPDGDGSVVSYSDTSVEVDVFQAIAGDANGDREVNNTDLQAILGAGSFGAGDGWGWGQGDFNGDGIVNNGDLQLILATGQFGAGPYAAMAAEAGAVVVPEPGTLLVLLSGALGLLFWRRRRAA